jgi:23S rRNA (adenine2503-C2)-methyltransferase
MPTTTENQSESVSTRKTPLLSLTLKEFEERMLSQLGEPPYRARQVWEWIFSKGVLEFEKMNNVPMPLRQRLAQEYTVLSSSIVQRQVAADKTGKILVEFADGQQVESVLIREEERLTACISTQVGCPIGCVFCASGRDGLARSLEDYEMVEQMLHLRSLLQGSRQRITHVVVMGMGEPMLNLRNLGRALLVVNDPKGFNIGQRHVTVSTVGFPKQIEELAAMDHQWNLAISLHAPGDELRQKLIPTSKGIAPLMEAAKKYYEATKREITFEYTLLKGVNDGPFHARDLAKLLRGFPCLVNLIPMNAVEGSGYEPPSPKVCETFAELLKKSGIRVTMRKEKGSEIAAACGQLKMQSKGHAKKPVPRKPAGDVKIRIKKRT